MEGYYDAILAPPCLSIASPRRFINMYQPGKKILTISNFSEVHWRKRPFNGETIFSNIIVYCSSVPNSNVINS